MDTPTAINSNITAKPVQKRHFLNLQLDVPLLLTVTFLLVFGLLIVYSASWRYDVIGQGKPPGTTLGKQLIFTLMGVAGAYLISRFDYHIFQKFGLLIMSVSLALLIAVLVFGEQRFGSTRTLFRGSIQPSELAKLAIIIYMSVWLFSKREQLTSILFGLLPMASIIGFTAILVILQPDISAAITIFLLGCLLFFLAGCDLRQILIIGIISIIFAVILYNISDTVKKRITEYYIGNKTPAEGSFQMIQSYEAIARGGILGVGIGNGESKYTGLPLAWSDSIFAVIVEETGLIGALVLITLYIILLWRGLSIGQNAPDLFGKLLASGVTFWIVFEAFLNMGVAVNLLPSAGNALPFISAGGSSLFTCLIGIGILLSISRTTNKMSSTPEGRSFGAVVDLRRRNGRRRLSRLDRHDGTEK